MRISEMIHAEQALRSYRTAASNQAGAIRRIASQERTAADDAAGLVLHERRRTDATTYRLAAKAALDTRGIVDTADAALSGVADDLRHVRHLVLGLGTLAVDVGAVRNVVAETLGAIQSSLDGASYGELRLFAGAPGLHTPVELSLIVGSDPSADLYGVRLRPIDLVELGLDGYDPTAAGALDVVDGALDVIGDRRVALGAASRALASIESFAAHQVELILAADDRNHGVDIARETLTYSVARSLTEWTSRLLGENNRRVTASVGSLVGSLRRDDDGSGGAIAGGAVIGGAFGDHARGIRSSVGSLVGGLFGDHARRERTPIGALLDVTT